MIASKTLMAPDMRPHRTITAAAMVAALLVSFFAAASQLQAAPAKAIDVAFLGVEFLNDNEGYQPTSDAERARIKNIESIFKGKLTESGQFNFVPVPDDIRAKIVTGQSIGACGGCEIDYGKKLKAERVAWIRVQKVSNLILNMNVYMADVATSKMTFVRSVDIRGNTDEQWATGMNWLIKHYMSPAPSA